MFNISSKELRYSMFSIFIFKTKFNKANIEFLNKSLKLVSGMKLKLLNKIGQTVLETYAGKQLS
jgi:hypothetical protein